MPLRLHHSTFEIIITIIAIVNGVGEKTFEKGKVFRIDNVSKTYLDLNNNVDR